MQGTASHEEFSNWQQCYFWGLSTVAPSQLQFNPEQLNYLQGLAGAEAAVCGLDALEPRHLINKAKATAWMLVFLSALHGDKAGLEAAASGKASIYVPAGRLLANFGEHVNWPEQLLQEFSFDFGSHRAFVVPFLRYGSLPAIRQFERSMQSPDGSVEVMGVEHFNDRAPHELLELFHDFGKRLAAQSRQ